MSTFEVPLVQIKIETHPNADAIELAVVGGFRAVVKKGRFETGDWVAYVPEGSVLPEWLLKQEGFWDYKKGKGMLAGSQGNRVKPVKLRGALSEGLVIRPFTRLDNDYSCVSFARHDPDYVDDPEAFKKKFSVDYDAEDRLDHVIETIMARPRDNLQNFFGITKFIPPIPVHMAGEVDNMHGWAIAFDVENAKRYPNILIPDEEVVITEKLHGTFCQMGYVPELDRFIVGSKGLSAKGLVFKMNEKNKDNLYVRTASMDNPSLLEKIKEIALTMNEPVYVLGEIFGRGVQDLSYGMQMPTFRAFDMYVGKPQKGNYLDYDFFRHNCGELGIPTVPLLYRGPYSYEKMAELTDGPETLSGTNYNIREGVVVKPVHERRDDLIGRVLMKHVSEKYLTRKGNTTEFT